MMVYSYSNPSRFAFHTIIFKLDLSSDKKFKTKDIIKFVQCGQLNDDFAKNRLTIVHSFISAN